MKIEVLFVAKFSYIYAICTKEIYKIKKDIEKKEKLLSKYDEAIKNVDISRVDRDYIEEKKYKN